MRIIKPGLKVLTETSYLDAIRLVAGAGRTCYKSTPGDLEVEEALIRKLIKAGHESVIEHFSISVWLMTSRTVSHQLVRHRHFSFSQESQRYCNYGPNGKESVAFINPGLEEDSQAYLAWSNACQMASATYESLLSEGEKPEVARSILPNCTKTELVVTGNVRSWRHIFKLRTAEDAQPETRALMIKTLEALKEAYPVFFEDLEV